MEGVGLGRRESRGQGRPISRTDHGRLAVDRPVRLACIAPPAPTIAGRANARADQHVVPRDHDVPWQRDAGLLRRGTDPSASGDPLELPDHRGALLEVHGPRGNARLVRDRMDRATERDRARRRLDRDPRRRVRRELPLPGWPDRTADPAGPGDRRPREGVGHLAIRTDTRCTTRVRATTCSASSPWIARARPCSGPSTPRRPCRDPCGTTTGTGPRWCSATTWWKAERTAGSMS